MTIPPLSFSVLCGVIWWLLLLFREKGMLANYDDVNMELLGLDGRMDDLHEDLNGSNGHMTDMGFWRSGCLQAQGDTWIP